MTMGMAGFTLGGRTEHGRNVIEAFDIRFGREIQITAIRLRLPREGVLEVFLGLGSIELHGSTSERMEKFRLILMACNLCPRAGIVNASGSESVVLLSPHGTETGN